MAASVHVENDQGVVSRLFADLGLANPKYRSRCCHDADRSSLRAVGTRGRQTSGADTVFAMDHQPWPHTVASLRADLRALGVVAGDVLLLHSSRSSIGFVAGGPQAIVQALLDVLGVEGTLVVPTHTPDNTDPATWRNPPVPEPWWSVIRERSPGFDPALTPASRWMGILAETVRNWPGSVRSSHPQVSFAAVGAQAVEVTAGHRIDGRWAIARPSVRSTGSTARCSCWVSATTPTRHCIWPSGAS